MRGWIFGGQRTAFSLAPRRLLVVAALLGALLGTLALAGCNIGDTGQVVGAPTATPAAQPTATEPIPNSGPPAVLGASGQAFITKYGQPGSRSNVTLGELHFHDYGAFGDYLVIQEGRYLNISPGGSNIFSILVAAPPGQPWTVSDAKHICGGFVPTDAQQQATTPTTSAGAIVGWDTAYQSARLTSVFPPSAFVDANRNPAPDGSFDISYVYASSGDTGHVTSCTIAIGRTAG